MTISPVTHTADVDVNNASTKEHPPTFDIGSIRSNAPVRITDRNPIASIRGGDSFSFMSNYFKEFVRISQYLSAICDPRYAIPDVGR